MQIRVNGEPREVADGMTVDHLLTELNIQRRFLAVERNQEIVPREEFANQVLTAGDDLEIVTLVGGG
jgi:thiamine biosynthesis protein ThiS